MPDQKHVAPTFVNTLAINGFNNGICNLAFSTASWFPHTIEGTVKVGLSEPITVDLRMDLACAQQVRDALDRILSEQTKPKPQDVN